MITLSYPTVIYLKSIVKSNSSEIQKSKSNFM